ncbi:MAG: hypothetical protein AAB505_02420, partial [Patescibacteria group bacterium]
MSTLLDHATIASGDAVLFDIEIWGKPGALEYYYPLVIQNSATRYSGSKDERYEQYEANWLARGRDVLNRVKSRSQNILTLFYGENVPDRENVDREQYEQLHMLPGTGDHPSPDFYWSPDLNKVRFLLGQADYSGSYPWVSFSYSRSGATNWDPEISQRLGLLLREEGVAGAIVYPGPGDHEVPVDYFMAHARAFADGFLRGLDPDVIPPEPSPELPVNPPPLLPSSPICGNGVIENGERCDGANLSGQTCVSRGFVRGQLICRANCTFDTRQCSNVQPAASSTPPNPPPAPISTSTPPLPPSPPPPVILPGSVVPSFSPPPRATNFNPVVPTVPIDIPPPPPP